MEHPSQARGYCLGYPGDRYCDLIWEPIRRGARVAAREREEVVSAVTRRFAAEEVGPMTSRGLEAASTYRQLSGRARVTAIAPFARAGPVMSAVTLVGLRSRMPPVGSASLACAQRPAVGLPLAGRGPALFARGSWRRAVSAGAATPSRLRRCCSHSQRRLIGPPESPLRRKTLTWCRPIRRFAVTDAIIGAFILTSTLSAVSRSNATRASRRVSREDFAAILDALASVFV